MVNTNANYIIGPTKEKIRESYRDFREKKKEMARTASTTFFHALFRLSFSDENRACEKYIAHSRKESKDRSSIHRSSSGSSVPRWDAGWVEKDFFFFRNKYGMIMEWPKRLERMIDRTITFLFLFLFFFCFCFYLMSWIPCLTVYPFYLWYIYQYLLSLSRSMSLFNFTPFYFHVILFFFLFFLFIAI